MAAQPLDYDVVVDGIRAGIRSAKGVPLTNEEITDSTHFWVTDNVDEPSLSLDSIEFLRLILFLEEEFGWPIPETDIDAVECRTVGDLALLVTKNARNEPQCPDV